MRAILSSLGVGLTLALHSVLALADTCADADAACDTVPVIGAAIPAPGVLELAGIGAAAAIAVYLYRRKK